MIIEQPPLLLKWLYPQALWRMDKNEKAVYLTFDDGPIPNITPWVLDILDRYQIKATFFMVGDNVVKHPNEFKQVVERGHRIGNHTFNHIKGFGRSIRQYMKNTEQANELLKTNLFRPPHGHMKAGQYAALKRRYKIVMWDLVTRDYSKHLNGKQVLAKVKKYVRNGSIITFHDSIKSQKNIEYALPRAIEWLLKEGYTFKVFDE
jgi:peptidoglycan/xylan/chitin deacetylase (PgdA/CDA1 family)